MPESEVSRRTLMTLPLTVPQADSGFSRNSLHTPITRDGSITRVGHRYFLGGELLVFPNAFPCAVEIPFEKPQFIELCKRALALEQALIRRLYVDRRGAGDEAASTLDDLLTSHPVTANILLRAEALRECDNQVVAGIYLGTPRFDKNLGVVLFNQLSKAYRHAYGIRKLESFMPLCDAWGEVQSEARNLILKASWETLQGTRNWCIPEGFLTNLSYLLEHDAAQGIQGKPGPWRLSEEAHDRFTAWFGQVERLQEPVVDRLLLGLTPKVQSWARSGTKQIPENLVRELLNDNHAAWLDLLQNGSPLSLTRFRDRLWDKEARPLALDLKDGCIEHLRLNAEQALDFCSSYVAIPTLQRITVAIPSRNNPARGYPQPSCDFTTARKQLEELAQLPIAPFIRCISFDASRWSPREAGDVLGCFTLFLEDLADSPDWRDRSRCQIVALELRDPNEELQRIMQEQAFSESESANICLSPAKLTSHGHYFSVSIDGTVKAVHDDM